MQPLPAQDPARLADQLRDAVARGQPVRRYVRAILADVWRAVHLGDAGAAGRWRNAIARYAADVREHEEVRRLDEVLEVACTALREGPVGPAERRLVEDLRPLVQVLWERRGEPLSRADLLRLLGSSERWTNAHSLSYPLEQLAEAEMVLLTTRPRQGGSATRHYALSALGIRACVEAGLARAERENADADRSWSGAMEQLLQAPPKARRFPLRDHSIPAGR